MDGAIDLIAPNDSVFSRDRDGRDVRRKLVFLIGGARMKVTKRATYYGDEFDSPLFSSDDPCCAKAAVLMEDPCNEEAPESVQSTG